ncbi:flavin reductase family protein [Kutzneria buriramensis]|uniref:Flavin reductase ActVB n=1 Tax=Kutzneria buriramensis TaxID=1045776 RepID=A0A3E0GX88_9PSEU|nr:flavin reductase family protein [Kutzneria buriramensis]REH32551.1 flavin reductase ActVB [Kutzneria buriramensis]
MTARAGIDADTFRAAMARYPAGVTVATTVDDEGRSFAFTASSFCSVSADPPLILLCLSTSANSFPAFSRCARFTVSILREHHVDVANRCATKDVDKLAAGFVPAEGAPAVEDALCVLSCETVNVWPAGDHVVLVGEVVAATVRDGAPMVYFNRSFRRLVGG